MTDPKLRRGPGRRKSMSKVRSGQCRRSEFRPRVEAVEARILLTVFAVPSTQYPTIESAVAAANGMPDASNVVSVAPGTYVESNIAITSPLTLISTGGAGSTTIESSSNSTPASSPQDGTLEVLPNTSGVTGSVTIGDTNQGFTFQTPPVSAATGDINLIDLQGGGYTSTTIQDNTLTGLNGVNNPFDTGVLAEGTPAGSPINLLDNTFQQMWQGVLFQQTVGAGSITGNTFTDLAPSTDTTVSPNQVDEPEAIFALTFGGPSFDVSGLVIDSNTFTAFNGLAITVDGGYQGYTPAQFSDVQIDDNNIQSISYNNVTDGAGIVLIDDPGSSGTGGSAGGVVGSTISDNTIAAQTSCASGSVGVWVLGTDNKLIIDNNYFQNLDRGILIDLQVPSEAYASDVKANENSFTGNNIGISNPSSNSIDASYNYWGTTDATSVKAQANGGVNVDYNPWLGDGTDTSSDPGFQPSLTPAITDAAQISGSDSVESGSPYTLTLSQVSSPQHIGTINSFTVDWGDGTTTSDMTQHTYTPTVQTTYTISATVTNTAGQTFQVANSQAVTATVVPTLVVTTFTPTASGFHVRFNYPINTSVLNLYASPTAANPSPSDVTLAGPNGPVSGTLKLDPDDKGFTFVATALPLASQAAGTYTATFVGATGGVEQGSGGPSPDSPLDGTRSGTPGSNYVTTFDVAANSGPVVTLPDFARGPGQPVIVPADAGTSANPNAPKTLPIQINDGSNSDISSVMLVLTYDPSLLTIAGVTLDAADPAGTQIVTNSTIPGRLAICITTAAGSYLGTGLQNLVDLDASVRTSAPYLSKQVLDLQVVDVNGATTLGVGDQAVGLVDFLGNTTGLGYYNSQDVTYIRQYLASSLSDDGFGAFPLVDPTIIADIADGDDTADPGDDYITSQDATYIREVLAAPSPSAYPPQVPANTVQPSSFATGPDPELFLSRTLAGMPGDSLSVPVQLLQTNGTAIDLRSFNLVLSYDPATFSVTDVELGALASGFQLTDRVDAADGLIFISGSGSRPLTLAPGTLGDLVDIDFQVLAAAAKGSSAINLLDNSGASITSLNGGGLTLVPAPTNASNDPNDGLVAIGGRRTQSPFAPGRGPVFATIPAAVVPGLPAAVVPVVRAVARQEESPALPTLKSSTSPTHDLAIESLAADLSGSGSPGYLIPLTLGVIPDNATSTTAGPNLANGAAIAARHVVFRHQSLARVIATADPSK